MGGELWQGGIFFVHLLLLQLFLVERLVKLFSGWKKLLVRGSRSRRGTSTTTPTTVWAVVSLLLMLLLLLLEAVLVQNKVLHGF